MNILNYPEWSGRATLSLICLMAASPSHGHDQVGVVGAEPSAASNYTVVCSGGDSSTRLIAAVNNLQPKAPPPLLISISKDGQTATAADYTDGDGNSSDWAILAAGDGTYQMSISKLPSSPGAPDSTRAYSQSYDISYHCMTGDTHTDTAIYVNGSTVTPSNPVTPVVTSSARFLDAPGTLSKTRNEVHYQVACSAKKGADTARYRFMVKGVTKNRPFNVRLSVSKDGNNVSVIDPANGDRAGSNSGLLEAGNGLYQLTVSKDSSTGDTYGSMVFDIRHVCETAAGSRANLKGPKKVP